MSASPAALSPRNGGEGEEASPEAAESRADESTAIPPATHSTSIVTDGISLGLQPIPGPHPLRTKRILVPLGILLFVLNIPFIHLALRGEATVTTTIPFTDDFGRADLGGDYFSTGGHWRIVDGALLSPGVKNNPLWLQAKLPRDVVVEVTAKSLTDDGDIKLELFGNGRDHASGYVLVFGGWKNTISTIARLDEHGSDRVERRDRKVEKDRVYRFRVQREGGKLSWFIDGELFMEFDDAKPLSGPGHDRVALGTWRTDVVFDDLDVRPLHPAVAH